MTQCQYDVARSSSMEESQACKEQIRSYARSLGFDDVGFARAQLSDKNRTDLATYLEQGRHGDMEWMRLTQERRGEPRILWPEAVSVISMGMNYAPGEDVLQDLKKPETGYISLYARHRDYHDVIKKRLKQLAGWMYRTLGHDVKVFVDTAPVMEKPLAAAAGLGWQGKHTNIVSRRFGSWLFLGEILTTLNLPPDTPVQEHCGTCTRCLDICPTSAFDAAGRIDARKCISYLTIEHKGTIPPALRPHFGNRIYGCDDCTAICPWNRFASETPHVAFRPREDLTNQPLAELLRLDDTAFRAKFSGSPIKRIGRNRFIRNVLIAAGNSGLHVLMQDIQPLVYDLDSRVRGAAVWALSRLMAADRFEALFRHYHPCEPDQSVRDEWALGRTYARMQGTG